MGRGTSPPNGSLQKGTASKVRDSAGEPASGLCAIPGARTRVLHPGGQEPEGEKQQAARHSPERAPACGSPLSGSRGRGPLQPGKFRFVSGGPRAPSGSRIPAPGRVCPRSCGAQPEGRCPCPTSPPGLAGRPPLLQEVGPSRRLRVSGEVGEPLSLPLFPRNIIFRFTALTIHQQFALLIYHRQEDWHPRAHPHPHGFRGCVREYFGIISPRSHQ